jgi:hypothetical protein
MNWLKSRKKKSQTKKISIKLHNSGFQGFEITTENGEEWSVLNFADSMKNHPYKKGLYLGWEGWNGERAIRGTLREILEEIIFLLS